MQKILTNRQAGVLLHPTSLPNGMLDQHAWLFLDWMEKAGFSIWQMLPLTPPVQGISPYLSDSAFAMNPALLPENWEQDFLQDQTQQNEFSRYLKQPPHWLHDYALFKVLKTQTQDQSWSQWAACYRYRDEKALKNFAKAHQDELLWYKKQQFAIHALWSRLKYDANKKGIKLFGDMPIFVAYDSVDVWANPEQFKLDTELNPTVVTGVPPDYFSEDGQRWGNPHYNWSAMQVDGFTWWLSRIRTALSIFDVLRIDHFRGLDAVWEINTEEETAIHGCWVKTPGVELLQKVQEAHPDLPLVAEDLGFITPEVIALKNEFNLPGMSVLQFGFDGHHENPHSLRNQVENSVVYTGTHDNDTVLGWLESLDPHTKYLVESDLAMCEGSMPWPVVVAALNSRAQWAIIPMQDILELGTEARMNVPGVIGDNWLWQFNWSQVAEELAEKLNGYIHTSGRTKILNQNDDVVKESHYG